MSNQTGASNAKIEAAVQRATSWKKENGWFVEEDRVRDQLEAAASALVRPEEAIFLRSDVRIMLDFYEVNNWEAITPDVLDRLAAVLGDRS